MCVESIEPCIPRPITGVGDIRGRGRLQMIMLALAVVLVVLLIAGLF
jgi:hypothetical protein